MMTRFIRFCIQPLHHSRPGARVFDQLLDRARSALRMGEIGQAEAFVMENGDAVWLSAPCLNLLGLIAESRGQWRRAWQMWSRSARKDRHYAPAYQNLRRYFELYQFGRSHVLAAFGDEPQFILMAQGVRT